MKIFVNNVYDKEWISLGIKSLIEKYEWRV